MGKNYRNKIYDIKEDNIYVWNNDNIMNMKDIRYPHWMKHKKWYCILCIFKY